MAHYIGHKHYDEWKRFYENGQQCLIDKIRKELPNSYQIIKEKETNSIIDKSLTDLSNENWSEWSECSDSCGGCGIQNRTLIFPNDTHIVHVRHCNLKPCMDEEELCCEPFKFINEKCLVPEKIQNETKTDDSEDQKKEAIDVWKSIKEDDQSKFNNSEDQRGEALRAWESIKGDDKSKFDDSQDQREEAILAWKNIKDNEPKYDDSKDEKEEVLRAWKSIKGVELSSNNKFGNTNSEEIDTVFNMTRRTVTSLNDTRNSDLIEGSGEIDNEMDSKTNNTEIPKFGIENWDAPRDSKRKNKSGRKGYDRKNYKRRQRRNRQHLPRRVSKPKDAQKSGKSQKMFDETYEYDYYDYYYYY
uniref:Uncharacterized protein n=3 Tax=Wuchereria bancrofti TaxID=6293 RepID=A0A1I8ELB0_WUCBA